MSKLDLDRAQIAKIAGGVPQTIAGLERLLNNVAGFPSTIEEANALAGSALAVAQAAMASLAVLADALAALDAGPVARPLVDPDDSAPRQHMGTMSTQNADLVEITGGTAVLSTLLASGQITSTVATGTPPLVIASKDLVANLYVARAAVADSASLGTPTTYPAPATDLPTAITLVNALRAAAINKGL